LATRNARATIPLALVTSSNAVLETNLLMRAVVGFPGAPPQPTTTAFELTVDRPETHVAQGDSAQFQLRLTGDSSGIGSIALTVSIETPDLNGLSVKLGSATAKSGDTIPLDVFTSATATARTASIRISASLGTNIGTRTVAVNVRRALATAVLGAKGGVLITPEGDIEMRVPPGACRRSDREPGGGERDGERAAFRSDSQMTSFPCGKRYSE